MNKLRADKTSEVRKSSPPDLATDTRTPSVAQFGTADADKTAYDWHRWENTKGETGPWSAAVSATITGLNSQ